MVVMIPRLLWEEEWRSHFKKEVDLWIILDDGSIWPRSALESLFLGWNFFLHSPSI
jgi:hypothetical protein